MTCLKTRQLLRTLPVPSTLVIRSLPAFDLTDWFGTGKVRVFAAPGSGRARATLAGTTTGSPAAIKWCNLAAPGRYRSSDRRERMGQGDEEDT